MDQQAEPPLTHQLQHPAEEEEHHETGASKMFRKVKARARKFKNSITKHGQSHEDDHDVVEDDDEDDDELEPEVIGGATGSKPESLSHPRETNVPATGEIVPPGTKVFPVVSSGHSKPVESVPLQDTSYGHDAPAHSVRTDKEERRDVPIHQPLSDLSDRGESREAHHESMNTHVPLFSGTEDVTKTSTPTGEDEYLGGQRKVNVDSPKKFEENAVAPGGGSDYLTNPTHDELVESLERMEVRDEPTRQRSGQGFERDVSRRSKEFREFDQDFDSVLSKDSPARVEGESEAELQGKHFPTRSQDSDMKTEAGFEKDSPSRSHDFDMKTESGIDKKSPSRSHEFDLKTESGFAKDSPMGFGAKSGAELGEEFPTRSQEFDQKIGSGKNEYSPTESDIGLGAPMGGNFPVRSSELGQKNDSGLDKDTPTGFDGESDFLAKGRPGYGEEPEEENFPAKSDDVKVENDLGRDLPMGTHAQSSPQLSRPKERDDFLETRDSFDDTTTQETKPSAYTEQFATAASALSSQAVAVKNAVTSKLGYTGESTIPVGDETQVAGSVDEKLTPVNEKDRETESTNLPLSGGGSGVAEKLTPEEEDKAFSDMVAEKLQIGGEEKKATSTKEVEVEKIPTEKISEEKEHGEVDAEEVKEGGGMVGMIKGWFGGAATEEVKPESPHSVEESQKPRGWFGGNATEEVKQESPHAVEESPKARGWFGGAATEEVKPESPHTVEESPKSRGWFSGAATEEVKPESPHSVEDSSSQSLGTTVGTKGFSETSGGELGKTDGAVPVQRGL